MVDEAASERARRAEALRHRPEAPVVPGPYFRVARDKRPCRDGRAHWEDRWDEG